MAEFRRSVEVDCPVGEVFEWHPDTRTATLISPPSLRVVEVDGTFPLSGGDEASLHVKPRGLSVRGGGRGSCSPRLAQPGRIVAP